MIFQNMIKFKIRTKFLYARALILIYIDWIDVIKIKLFRNIHNQKGNRFIMKKIMTLRIKFCLRKYKRKLNLQNNLKINIVLFKKIFKKYINLVSESNKMTNKIW